MSGHRDSDIGPPWMKEQIQEELERHRPSNFTISPALSHHACKVAAVFFLFKIETNCAIGQKSCLVNGNFKVKTEDIG